MCASNIHIHFLKFVSWHIFFSEAENAIRKINDCQSLGIKADFAHETKNKNRNQPFEDLIRMKQTPEYETDIMWEGR